MVTVHTLVPKRAEMETYLLSITAWNSKEDKGRESRDPG